MTERYFILSMVLVSLSFHGIYSYAGSANTATTEEMSRGTERVIIPCSWKKISGSTKISVEKIDRPAAFYNVLTGPKGTAPSVYGAYLDLKYFSGLSYPKLRNMLPGKKISLKVIIPRSTLLKLTPGEPKLRIVLKSLSGDTWVDYAPGDGWTDIAPKGPASLEAVIPEGPVTTAKNMIFDPRDTIALSVEFWSGKLKETNVHIFVLIEDLKIEGLPLDMKNIRWKPIKDNVTIEGSFLPVLPAGSTVAITDGDTLIRSRMDPSAAVPPAMSSDNYFISLPVMLDKRSMPESLDLNTVITYPGSEITMNKHISKDNPEKRFTFMLPVKKTNIDTLAKNKFKDFSIDLKIATTPLGLPVPVTIGPLSLNEGTLVPFDNTWEQRDIQGLGGYKCIDKTGNIEPCGITISHTGTDSYSVFSTLRLKGGIDWNNPFYRIELKKDLEDRPVDLEDHLIEMSIDPVTDTTELWQTPYRARIGLIDTNGKVMLGPNVSLSEGVTNTASLNVSLDSPTPKGMVMPGFDPKKVNSIIVNIESSQQETDMMNMSLYLSDLIIREVRFPAGPGYKNIDFSRFSVEPEKWTIKKIVEENGGYTAGINYPFPTVKVSAKTLEVPQIYPVVGRKPDDPGHFGFSSPITSTQTIRDLTSLTSMGIRLIRIFILGHLDGVFDWDVSGKQIQGFDDAQEKLLASASHLPIEKFAVFLRENENALFPEPDRINGLGNMTLPDLKALLNILETVKNSSGISPSIIFTLYDYTFADAITEEGPLKKYMVGEHTEIVTDPLTKAKAHAIIWKTIKILYADPRFKRYVGAIDVINEPSNAVALTKPDAFPELVNMTGETLYLVKDIVNPDIPVTVGFRSWPYDLRYWHSIGEGIDILMPHYWESLESYNINTPGLWPLGMKVDKLWDMLGTPKGGRMTAMGEISPIRGKVKEYLRILKEAGYDFSLVWSFSGHDGFDAKPVLDEITPYVKK